MATEKDVVDELISKTESGTIQWQPHVQGMVTSYWMSSGADCQFTLYADGRLGVHTQGQLVFIAEKAQTLEMLNLVSTQFKGDVVSKDEALKHALDCLKA